MNKTADIVIVGGGIIGSSIAYELAKSGLDNILVIDKSYLSSGSTGRCGAGVRQQWGTEMNCRLAKGSVDIFEKLTEELEMDIEFRQGGYLTLIQRDSQIEQFQKNITLQNSLDIPSRLVDKKQAKEICPYLNTDEIISAAYCPTDGHANPFLTNFAYARAAERLGVTIERHTEVLSIEILPNDVKRVRTDKFVVEAPIVINAAGGFSKEVAQMVGMEIPTFSERHQILVTEPLEHKFDTMVISFVSGIYLQQVPHGSFVMGIGEKEDPSHNINSSWQFLELISDELVKILPFMKDVRIVRQWAGSYNKTPDAQPIIGEAEEIPGFFNAVGFSGHGFMIAPMTAVIMAELINKKTPSIDISPLSATRFERGNLFLEPAVVG